MVNTVSRDAYLSIGLVFVVLFALFASIPKKQEAEAQPNPPGNLIVSIVWPEGPTDVDLWLDGPNEPRPVGYSNKSGRLWNLLRDDLGTSGDATWMNYESAYSRGVVAGDYTVNLHLYATQQSLPIVVHVEVSIVNGNDRPLLKLATVKVVLTAKGQEKTALRFTLTEDGRIRDGSTSTVFRPLRSAKR